MAQLNRHTALIGDAKGLMNKSLLLCVNSNALHDKFQAFATASFLIEAL
jgi:hypothetical protein